MSHPSVVLLMLLVLCGCGDAARPLGSHSEQVVVALKKIELRDGQTRADEVRRALGEPDYRNDDGSLVAYHWETGTRHVTDKGRVSRKRLDDGPDRYLLLMEFDDAGLLSRHRRRRVPVSQTPSWMFEKVAERWGVSPATPSTRPAPDSG